jgi:hypothetical protein
VRDGAKFWAVDEAKNQLLTLSGYFTFSRAAKYLALHKNSVTNNCGVFKHAFSRARSCPQFAFLKGA